MTEEELCEVDVENNNLPFVAVLNKDKSTKEVKEVSTDYELEGNEVFTTKEKYEIDQKKNIGKTFDDAVDDVKAEQLNKIKKFIKIDNFIDNVEQFWSVQPFFYDQSGIFWFWKENKYVQTDDVDVMNMLDDTLGFMGQTVNSRLKSHYMEAFKRIGRKHIPQDAPSKWIQFKNIAFSIESGKSYKVEPNFFFTNPIPFEIGKTSETPTIDKLFTEWVGEKYKETLYELIAYCCYIDYPIQLLFCLVGSGRNGKGCFLKILDTFLGDDNVTSTSLDLISGNNKSRFESFRLYKKLVALVGETNFGLLTSTSLLKQLTGGDKIGFEKKGKDPFSAFNYAKIIIASNSLPTTQDTSDGFFRRWMIIDFANEFPEGKDITKTVPIEEYSCLAKRVIDILPKLLEKGSFTNQGGIEERKLRYTLSSNPLPLFIERCCDKGDDAYVSYNELYTAYIKILRVLKKRRVSRKEFKASLEDEGLWIEKTSHLINDEWKTLLNIEGLSINLTNFAFFTNNPYSFFNLRSGVGKVVKKAEKEIKQDTLIECEELIGDYQGHCKTCGSVPCRYYGLGHYFCSKDCFGQYEAQK